LGGDGRNTCAHNLASRPVAAKHTPAGRRALDTHRVKATVEKKKKTFALKKTMVVSVKSGAYIVEKTGRMRSKKGETNDGPKKRGYRQGEGRHGVKGGKIYQERGGPEQVDLLQKNGGSRFPFGVSSKNSLSGGKHSVRQGNKFVKIKPVRECPTDQAYCPVEQKTSNERK